MAATRHRQLAQAPRTATGPLGQPGEPAPDGPALRPARDAFVARSGRMMVPFLVDPNTDTAMFESAEMLRYLDDTYAA